MIWIGIDGFGNSLKAMNCASGCFASCLVDLRISIWSFLFRQICPKNQNTPRFSRRWSKERYQVVSDRNRESSEVVRLDIKRGCRWERGAMRKGPHIICNSNSVQIDYRGLSHAVPLFSYHYRTLVPQFCCVLNLNYRGIGKFWAKFRPVPRFSGSSLDLGTDLRYKGISLV